jgi:hypothetical protein
MNQTPQWTSDELELWRQQSVDLFRRARLDEPLEIYGEAFDQYRGAVEALIEQTVDLSKLREQAQKVLADPINREIVRYLAGPPISEDDLNTLIDIPAITVRRITATPDLAQRAIDLIMNGLDQRRFPWVRDGRDPTEAEKLAAVIASAALLAYRRVATNRRNYGKDQQEAAVMEKLTAIGWKTVARRKFTSVDDAPKPGEFCRETIVGSNKADLLVRLMDRRLMPIECKVSNSSLNSIKRLNDALKKAKEWTDDFGKSWVVPVAVLSGVFNLKHLMQTQQRGLALFWAHDLDRLAVWIEAAKVEPPEPRPTKRER